MIVWRSSQGPERQFALPNSHERPQQDDKERRTSVTDMISVPYGLKASIGSREAARNDKGPVVLLEVLSWLTSKFNEGSLPAKGRASPTALCRPDTESHKPLGCTTGSVWRNCCLEFVRFPMPGSSHKSCFQAAQEFPSPREVVARHQRGANFACSTNWHQPEVGSAPCKKDEVNSDGVLPRTCRRSCCA